MTKRYLPNFSSNSPIKEALIAPIKEDALYDTSHSVNQIHDLSIVVGLKGENISPFYYYV